MYIQLFTLFCTCLLSGLLCYLFPTRTDRYFSHLLVFSGSYLFSITLVHLLPELFFHATLPATKVGSYLLLGFFLQFFLDFFGHGIAHGHMSMSSRSLHPLQPTALVLLLSLCLHEVLDGLLLSVTSLPTLDTHHPTHASHSNGLFLGILLHKLPAAFALGTLLRHLGHTRLTIWGYLIIFSLTSPLSWVAGNYLHGHLAIHGELTTTLWAVATGSLLHIATTILAEAHTEHRVSLHKLGANLAGILLAWAVSAIS